jgi:YolD-like protein
MKHEFAGMGKIKDRGIVKWAPFFLAEHRGELRKFSVDLNHREQPILTDERRDELDETVNQAMAGNNDVMVLVFSRGTYRELSGKIERLVPINGTLSINGQPIELDLIIDVKIV